MWWFQKDLLELFDPKLGEMIPNVGFKYVSKGPTKWAPTSYKWGYIPYKWPYKWVTGVKKPYQLVLLVAFLLRFPVAQIHPGIKPSQDEVPFNLTTFSSLVWFGLAVFI